MRLLLSALFCLTLPFSPSFAQDLESILEAHYHAAAMEKMQGVKTLITSGINSNSTASYKSEFRIYQARPGKIRVEGGDKDSKVIQTFNGTTGWVYAPALGVEEPTEIKGQELETLVSQVVFESPLWNYKEKGATIELVSNQEDTDHHLMLSSGESSVQHIYIDRESHLISSVRSSQVMGGSEKEMEVVIESYKTVKGIPFAVKVTTKMDGQMVTSTSIEKMEVNKKLNPSLFEKPNIK